MLARLLQAIVSHHKNRRIVVASILGQICYYYALSAQRQSSQHAETLGFPEVASALMYSFGLRSNEVTSNGKTIKEGFNKS